MLGSLARLVAIMFRERPAELKPGIRYRVTLDLEKVRAAMPAVGGQRTDADLANWLMKMGLTPTGKEDVWKAQEHMLRRVPKAAILRAEKL